MANVTLNGNRYSDSASPEVAGDRNIGGVGNRNNFFPLLNDFVTVANSVAAPLANIAGSVSSAATSATNAENAKNAAASSSSSASTSASTATTQANAASSSANVAAVQAGYAQTHANNASASADQAAINAANVTPNSLSIGTVTSGVTPSATVTGATPNQTLNLVLVKGDKGDTGATGSGGIQSASDFLASKAKVNGIIRNGSCQDGTNSGYSGLAFSNDRPPPNTIGFFRKDNGYAQIIADDYMPVSVSQVYLIKADVRQLTRSASTRLYAGIIQYDSEPAPLVIYAINCCFVAGTKTTLAAPLSVGNTTVTLTSSASWNNSADWYSKGISFYNYKNSLGFEYDHTVNPYTRWIFRPSGVGAWNNGGISGNTITLSQPFNFPNPAAGSGGVWPAGTVVANTSDGGSYNYVLSSGLILPASTNFTSLSAFFGGAIGTSGADDNTKFRAGVDKVKLVGLYNYSGTSTDVVDIANIYMDIAPITRSIAGLTA